MAQRLPPWDRTVDATFQRKPDGKETVNEARRFKQAVTEAYMTSQHQPGTNENQKLFRLPAKIRFQICSYALGSDEARRPIRMNSMVHNQMVWPSDYFDSFEGATASCEGGLVACFALRADLMAALFTTRRFHITLSPFVTPKSCPMGTKFMDRYGHLMRWITLEIDFTKFGYGPGQQAAGLAPGTLNVGRLVDDFVSGQKKRKNLSRVESLVILCRRFYGSRPALASNGQPSPLDVVPYVGPEHEKVVEPIFCLRWLVQSARIVGFSENFTHKAIEYLYDDMPQDTDEQLRHIWRKRPSTVWPLLPGQSSFHDYGLQSGHRDLRLVQHARLPTNIDPFTGMSGGVSYRFSGLTIGGGSGEDKSSSGSSTVVPATIKAGFKELVKKKIGKGQ